MCHRNKTETNCTIGDGYIVFACEACLEKAKTNFIWVCMECGLSFIRPKDLVIRRVKDIELKRACLEISHLQVIQGIEFCVNCNPDEVNDFNFENLQGGLDC